MQIISTKKWNQLQGQMKALQSGNMAAMINNFSTRIFPSWSVIKEMDAYQTMDMIYSVVNKLATCSAMIPFYGYDRKNGEDLPESDMLVKFLATLDYEEKIKLYTYLYLNGEVFAYKNKIEFGLNAGLQSLTFLHPARVSIQLSQTFPVEIVRYTYFDINNGIEIPIEVEDMIFIKKFNPSENIAEEFRGLSAVKVLARTLTQVQSAEGAVTGKLQNGGGKDIVYDKTPNLEAGAMGLRRDNYGRFARNTDNIGAPYFAPGEMGVIHLGDTLTDMEVVALAEVNFDRICNVFGISSILFNKKSASTESNVQEMVKEMYTNTLIPNVYMVEGKLNKEAVPDIRTKGMIKCDVSEIKALQEDQAKLVGALAAAWWLTPNEKRTAQMYDQDSDPLMDKYLVPTGVMLLDDLSLVVEPVDNTAGDYVTPTGDQATVIPIKKTGTNG